MTTLYKIDYIQKNKYTRPGILLKEVRKIVLHYTANPGASAENHQLYFNGTAIKNKIYASAHIFVDKDSAILIIPLNEVAYHANDNYERNNDGIAYRGVKELYPNANNYSIGVEMCIEKDGTIHMDTIKRTVEVVAELCKTYKLTEKEIVRHYDVTHKPCPKPFVDHPERFEEFKKHVNTLLNPPKSVEKPQPKYPGSLIREGSRGTNVKLVQQKVGATADGIFGPKTEAKVKDWQKKHGLVADGFVGPKSWEKMF